MASIPFHAIKLGAEHIPDKAFEKIPFAGPRYFKEKEKETDKREDRRERRRKNRRRRDEQESDSDQYDSYSDSDYDRSPRSSRPRRSHRRSERSYRRDDHKQRGYESDHGTQYTAPRAYAEVPYFPPPPTVPVNQPEDGQRDLGAEEAYTSRSYNPAEYGGQAGPGQVYQSEHPTDQQNYAPPSGPPPQNFTGQNPNLAPNSISGEFDRHSSVADRYRPQGYPPGSYDQFNRNASPAAQSRSSPNPTYPSALTIHPDPYAQYQPPPYNTYQPQSYDGGYSSEEDEPRQRKGRSGSKKGSSRSRSRVGDMTGKAKDGFEKHKKELGVSALGALAGGIIGNEFGGKKGKLGILLGAAIGGLGGGLYEKKNEEKRARQKVERRNSRHASRDGYDSY